MKGVLLLPSTIIIYFPLRHSNTRSFNRSEFFYVRLCDTIFGVTNLIETNRDNFRDYEPRQSG